VGDDSERLDGPLRFNPGRARIGLQEPIGVIEGHAILVSVAACRMVRVSWRALSGAMGIAALPPTRYCQISLERLGHTARFDADMRVIPGAARVKHYPCPFSSHGFRPKASTFATGR
jgi:hypothetical protein